MLPTDMPPAIKTSRRRPSCGRNGSFRRSSFHRYSPPFSLSICFCEQRISLLSVQTDDLRRHRHERCAGSRKSIVSIVPHTAVAVIASEASAAPRPIMKTIPSSSRYASARSMMTRQGNR